MTTMVDSEDVTSAGMRETAAGMREMSSECAGAHAECAKRLLVETDPKVRKATEALANVTDCMARRFRQWADVLDVAANEIDGA